MWSLSSRFYSVIWFFLTSYFVALVAYLGTVLCRAEINTRLWWYGEHTIAGFLSSCGMPTKLFWCLICPRVDFNQLAYFSSTFLPLFLISIFLRLNLVLNNLVPLGLFLLSWWSLCQICNSAIHSQKVSSKRWRPINGLFIKRSWKEHKEDIETWSKQQIMLKFKLESRINVCIFFVEKWFSKFTANFWKFLKISRKSTSRPKRLTFSVAIYKVGFYNSSKLR